MHEGVLREKREKSGGKTDDQKRGRPKRKKRTERKKREREDHYVEEFSSRGSLFVVLIETLGEKVSKIRRPSLRFGKARDSSGRDQEEGLL